LNHKWLKSDTLVDSSVSGKDNWKLVYLRLILNQIITTYWTVVKDLIQCESIENTMNNVESFRYSDEKLLLIFIILCEVLGIFLLPCVHF